MVWCLGAAGLCGMGRCVSGRAGLGSAVVPTSVESGCRGAGVPGCRGAGGSHVRVSGCVCVWGFGRAGFGESERRYPGVPSF